MDRLRNTGFDGALLVKYSNLLLWCVIAALKLVRWDPRGHASYKSARWDPSGSLLRLNHYGYSYVGIGIPGYSTAMPWSGTKVNYNVVP